MPTCRLRLSAPVHVEHQIAQAAQPGQRLAPAAHRAGEPRDLRQSARDQRRHRVVAEVQRLVDAGGDRDDVLQRRADLDADDVVGSVEPEGRAAKLVLHGAHRVGVGRGRHERRRQMPRDFRREARTRQHDHRMPAAGFVLR